MKRLLSLLILVGMVSACSTMSKLTIKQYTGPSGQKVSVGRYKPEASNQCHLQKQLSASWGFNGKLDPDGTYNQIVSEVVARAPSHHANYVYIVVPSGLSSGDDVNNSMAYTYYYNCKIPPG